ncbi:TPA: hypothetical protein N2D99_001977 [Clostridium botulinum]|nr:hypothetical protein [Clostridium botulinum]
MLKDLKFEEIVKFFKDIPNNQMGDITKSQIYTLAYNEQERRAKEEVINNTISGSKIKRIVNTSIISKDIAIIETIEKWNEKKEHIFHPIVKGKKISEVSNNFDYALLIALSNKYGQGNHAPSMIYNMLRMDKLDK